jgi:hypothetical protein
MKPPSSNAPSGAAVDSGLNDNHVRHAVTTFRYMDELLSKAEHIMVSAGSPSPFQEYTDDTTPIQRKVTHDYLARVREIMSRNLEELNIPAGVLAVLRAFISRMNEPGLLWKRDGEKFWPVG